MSQVIFLCTGNTCRSPIAAGLARQIFGPSHSIESAGAETGNGGPIAPNAVRAAANLGVNIVGQETRDLSGIDLTKFDLIVVFRPSSAENITIPAAVRVDYLDVDDPYGSSPEQYNRAARKIERGVRRIYVADANRRLAMEDAQASSHTAGIFNRAAKECEKEVAHFVADELRQQVSPKATLGQLGESILKVSRDSPARANLASAVNAANEVWVRIKHRSDPPADELREGLEAIQHVFESLEATA